MLIFGGFEIFPQGQAVIPSLVLPTSPKLNGAGAAGTASLTDDPYKFFFNPAHLGMQGKGLSFSSGFYPAKINWLPNYPLDLTLNSYVFTAGYDLQKIFPKLPLSIGMGYSRSELNFGQLLRDNSFGGEYYYNDYGRDYYSAYSIGIGYQSVVNISAGFTIKDVTSFLSQGPSSWEMPMGKAEGTGIDLGILIDVPVNNLIKEPLRFNVFSDKYINTDIDYTLGYTIQNIGDKVYYIDEAQAAPIPRTARLAHSLQIAFNLQSDSYSLELINFSYSIDADDILIKRGFKIENGDTTSQPTYQGMFGDIKPFKNLFLAENDPEIVLHKGLIVEFLETVTLMKGGFSGRGINSRKTDGIGFRSRGLFKLINIPLKSEIPNYIVDHFDIQYLNTTYFSGDPDETTFKGIYITVGGFSQGLF